MRHKIAYLPIWDYLIIIFLMMWSGGCVTYGLWDDWPIHLFPVFLIIFYTRGNRLKIKQLVPFLAIAIVIALQMFKFDGAPISFAHVVLVAFNCYLAAFIIKERFAKVFTRVMLSLAVVTLVIYLYEILGGHDTLAYIASSLPQGGREIMAEFDNKRDQSFTMWIYQVNLDSSSLYIRNAGPFWEPGRFTIYLNIALFFLLYYFNKAISNWTTILIVAAIISNLSTTGMITMLLIIAIYIWENDMPLILKIIFTAVFLSSIIYVENFSFMSDKISEQMGSDETFSRFGAIAYHYSQIVESPYIGFGPYLSKFFTELKVSPNGLSDSLRFFGIPLTLYLWYSLYKSGKVFFDDRLLAFSFLAILLVLAFTQTVTTSPFYYCLYFFSSVAIKHKADEYHL